jgi:hypothetical protein
MRTFNAAALALLARIAAGERIPWVQLVELQLSSTVYLTTAGESVDWNGHTWLSASALRIDPIEDGSAELPGLSFTLPGVQQADLALVLTEPVEGKTVRVYDALVDPATRVVADAIFAWGGTLNVPSIGYGPIASVTATAEHRGIVALRPKPRRYNNDDQQRRFPGDTCFNFDPGTDTGPIAWPKASYFRQ